MTACPKCGAESILSHVYEGCRLYLCGNRMDGGGYAPGCEINCLRRQLATTKERLEKVTATVTKIGDTMEPYLHEHLNTPLTEAVPMLLAERDNLQQRLARAVEACRKASENWASKDATEACRAIVQENATGGTETPKTTSKQQ